jgi:hypothetical protein
MSRTAEVVLAFAGEDRTFRLSIGRLRALQEKVDAGPMELLRRFEVGQWRVDDLRETIRQGLLGAGMSDADSAKLLKTDFDDLPWLQFVPIAQAIIIASVIGAGDESLGESQGEKATSPSPEANSGSEASTAAVRS